MSDTQMVPFQPSGDGAFTADEYAIAREVLVAKCREIAGGERNKGSIQASLAFFARFERAVHAGVLYAAPDGSVGERAFAVACRAFMEDE